MTENLIETIIHDVRDAEQQAQDIEKDAYQRGKTIVLDAEAEAAKQRRVTVLECKEDKKCALADAEKKAETIRQGILRKGEEDATALIDSKNSLVEEAADDIVAQLLEKY